MNKKIIPIVLKSEITKFVKANIFLLKYPTKFIVILEEKCKTSIKGVRYKKSEALSIYNEWCQRYS